jgi:iron complex transport system substrate-binding protein
MLWLMMALVLAPHRIVSTAPSITEMLFALGVGDQIVGVTTYCTYPEAAKAKPKIGGYLNPSLEAILAQRPDLVFVLRNQSDIGRNLRQGGVNVVELDHENRSGIYESIKTIANEIGLPERGRTLIASIEKELREASYKPDSKTRKPAVLFIVGRTPGSVTDLIVVGRGSYLNELIELAGGLNVAADAVIPYPRFSFEEVIHRNADVIIDMGHNGMETSAQKRTVKQLWRQYSFLRAVQREAVFPVSADYFITPGPRIGQAVRDIRKMIWR